MMKHAWENKGAYQSSDVGDTWESARSFWYCKKCGKKFIHHYHIMPDIYEAMEKAGCDKDDCPGVE